MRTSSLNQSRAVYEEKNTFHSKSGHVSLIRKELVALTGNHTHAVILNQLLYWTQRTKDFSLMLEEEKNRETATSAESPQYGWIYKTASDLVEETMLHVDRTTLRRYLKFLVKQKWLFERSNPQNKWNKTIQYRVNVQKIQEDLIALGLSEIPLSGLEKVNFKVNIIDNNVYIIIKIKYGNNTLPIYLENYVGKLFGKLFVRLIKYYKSSNK